MRALFVALALGACTPKAPPLSDAPWAPVRSQLPALDIVGAHTATVKSTRGQFVKGGGPEKLVGPVTAWVIRHPTEGLVLIDAGYGARTEADPKDYPGAMVSKLLGLDHIRGLGALLGDHGVDPAEVRWVLVTHGHHDHVGGIADLPNAKVVMDDREWNFARAQTRPKDPWPGEGHDWKLMAFGGPPLGPFEGSEDLFGDGSVIALPAPGHTPGSTMYLVSSATGSWLFTGDVAYVAENWQQPSPKGWFSRTFVEVNPRMAFEQLHRVKAFVAAHPEVVVIPGHDPRSFEALPGWRPQQGQSQ